MQQRLDFVLVENHQLLYDELFASIKQALAGEEKHKHLNFIKAIVGDDSNLETFGTILTRRDDLLSRSEQSTANETLYRQRLITPLLTDVLGYQLESLDPEEFVKDFGHIDDFYRWETRYLPIESKQYGRLQKDGLKISKQSNADPIRQITNYLRGTNWKLFKNKQTSIDAPYAILTDGLEWRLYHYDHLDNEQSPPCVILRLDSVDLDDEQQLTKVYHLLQLFFSEEATHRGGYLDILFDENRKRALAIQNNLGDQVFDAVEYIANGIFLRVSQWDNEQKAMTVRHYQQHFAGYEDDKEGWFRKVLYHESLVYLFRIIFGLYAEDRGLLESVNISYGLKQGERNLLRDIDRKFGNNSDDHGGADRKNNEHHINFFDNEDRRLETFYFAPINEKYNGGLFDPRRHPLLADFDINDRYFLRAIDYLLRTKDPHDKRKLATISYAQLDVRHLGTIYENLLEFSLEENDGSSADILPLKLINDKGERKATGSYYTPDYIVEYIVQQTVGAKIDAIIGDKLPTSKSAIKKTCDQILELNICDPAMGSGHFLIEVVTYIHTRISELISVLVHQQQEELTKHYTLSEIASRCVYGVDINYLAVELAKVVMWIKTFDPETPLQFLDANLKCGNSLIGTSVDQLFASDKMQQLNQIFQDMGRAETKAKQAITAIGKTINDYIAGASDVSSDIEQQKKQVELKYHLFKMLSYRLYDQVKKIPDRLGDHLPGLQVLEYKQQSKRKVAHIEAQWQELEDTFGELNPFKDWRALRKFFQIGLASYNAKYLLTVPLALEFVPESRDAINLGYESQVRQMLGGEKTTTLNMDTMHLPSDRYTGDGMSVTRAVDQVMQTINPFHREVEFPHVFAKGGFDCVVGNPPYVRIQNLGKQDKEYLTTYYETASYGNVDLYIPFMEKALNIINNSGKVGYIVPSVWIYTKYGEAISEYLLSNQYIDLFVDFGSYQVFADATVYTAIQIFSKDSKKHFDYVYASDGSLSGHKVVSIDYRSITSLSTAKTQQYKKVFDKLNTGVTLGDVAQIFVGVQTSFDKIYHLERVSGGYYSKHLDTIIDLEDVYLRPVCSGEDVKRYEPIATDKYVIFPYETDDKNAQLISLNTIQTKSPKLYGYLKQCEKALRGRERGKFDTDTRYQFGRNQNIDKQHFKKLTVARLVSQLQVSFDGGNFVLDNVDVNGISLINTEYAFLFILALLNSRLINVFFVNTAKPFRGDTFSANKQFLAPIPLPDGVTSHETIEKLADQMLTLHRDQHEIISSAHRLLERRCETEKIGRKLEKFWELDFADFLTELGKKNSSLKKLALEEEEKWESRFLEKQKAILDYQATIDALDAEIDQMVYTLYGLTDEEIKVVESAL